MVSQTDCPAMTIAVYLGRKATKQTKNPEFVIKEIHNLLLKRCIIVFPGYK